MSVGIIMRVNKDIELYSPPPLSLDLSVSPLVSNVVGALVPELPSAKPLSKIAFNMKMVLCIENKDIFMIIIKCNI